MEADGSTNSKMSTGMITTENISKHYNDVIAVSELSLNVRKGEIYGFLGLNGAGKTTTIRMLLGLIHPTSGSAYIKGERISHNNNRLWREVGSLVELPCSYPELTVNENLEVFRRLHFIDDRNSVDRIINKLQLRPYTNKRAKDLSMGNNQRLGLAKALIHEPEILILDEPSNGLDPAGIYEIREMLLDLAVNNDVTIFISSHILGEISRFATRIGIIHQGKLMEEFNANQLELICKKKLRVAAHDLERARLILTDKGFTVTKNTENILEIIDDDPICHPDQIATLLVNSGCPPTLLEVAEEDLESYFLRAIGLKGGIK